MPSSCISATATWSRASSRPSRTNARIGYGGDLAGRMRLALEIAARVRAEWPEERPLFCRISAVDGAEGGWSIGRSVVLARALAECGVDVIDVSSGGLTEETRRAAVPRGLGFQVPFAETIRREAGVVTQAVGMIVDGKQAEQVLRDGAADLVAIGREALNDPYWAHRAAEALGLPARITRSGLSGTGPGSPSANSTWVPHQGTTRRPGIRVSTRLTEAVTGSGALQAAPFRPYTHMTNCFAVYRM